MERYFKVSESELKELLRGYLTSIALEHGGVDNWDWYGESINDYIEDSCKELDIKPYIEVAGKENEDYVEDMTMEGLAEIYLQDYQEVE